MNKEEMIKVYFEGGNARGLQWSQLDECLKVIERHCKDGYDPDSEEKQ
jgi:hypothetical protein